MAICAKKKKRSTKTRVFGVQVTLSRIHQFSFKITMTSEWIITITVHKFTIHHHNTASEDCLFFSKVHQKTEHNAYLLDPILRLLPHFSEARLQQCNCRFKPIVCVEGHYQDIKMCDRKKQLSQPVQLSMFPVKIWILSVWRLQKIWCNASIWLYWQKIDHVCYMNQLIN